MEKLFYVTTSPLKLSGDQSDGIAKKLYSQYRIFQKYFDTYLFGYVGKDVGVYHDDRLIVRFPIRIKALRRFRLYEVVNRLIVENKPSSCYVRYGMSNKKYIEMLKKMREVGARIILEIPTFPYDLECSHSIKNELIKLFDLRYRMKLHDYVEKVATFSQDREIFGIPCIHIVNGICVGGIPVRCPVAAPDQIHLIGVATMAKFHGYDRLISGLAKYYREGGNRDVVFHLVGDGKELPNYRKSVKDLHLQDHVIFHGFQSGKALNDLFNLCSIAVMSLGLHRINIHLASSLKSREYAARGLPMITSCKIDVFPEDYPYLLKIPEDDSPVDIETVIRFHDKIYREKTEKDVIGEIRAFAERHCDMERTMQPVIQAFFSGSGRRHEGTI